MTEADIEIILQAAKEKHPQARLRIISDNGPQFIARDFKEFIRISGMTHVRTAPGYPQSNGKIERWHKSLKAECIRPGTPLTPKDARRLIEQYVDHYNTVRLHSAIGFVTPADMLAGRQAEIHAARDRKLEEARRQRQTAPPTSGMRSGVRMTGPGETEAGNAGMQPCRGIAWRAHRDDDRSAENPLPRSSNNLIGSVDPGSVDPDALKIPARRAEYSLTVNARSLFHAEPAHMDPYEIVRTVGFVIRAKKDNGRVSDANIRIEVAKLSSGAYEPMIWTLSPQMSYWIRHNAKSDAPDLIRDSADAALSAAIDYVDSRVMRATSQEQAQNARKVDRSELPAPTMVQNTQTATRELRFVIFCVVHRVPQSGPMDISIDALAKVSRLPPTACVLCNGEHYPSLLFGRRPSKRLKITLAINGNPAGDSADRAEGDGTGNFNLYSSTNQLLLTVPAELCSFTVEELWKE